MLNLKFLIASEISLCKLPKLTEEIIDDISEEEIQLTQDYLEIFFYLF